MANRRSGALDVPHGNKPTLIRAVVTAASAVGGRTVAEVSKATEISERHTQYYLHSARILGLVEKAEKRWSATSRGQALVSTQAGTEEVAAFRAAMAASNDVVRRFTIDEAKPTNKVARELQKFGLSKSSAARRASCLTSWRRYIETTITNEKETV